MHRCNRISSTAPVGADDSVRPFLRSSTAPKETLFEPILFFLCQKEKNGFNLPRKERERTKPYLRTVPPSCDSSFSRSYLPAPGHLTQSDYAPHAILMMAVRHHFTGTVQPSIFRCTL